MYVYMYIYIYIYIYVEVCILSSTLSFVGIPIDIWYIVNYYLFLMIYLADLWQFTNLKSVFILVPMCPWQYSFVVMLERCRYKYTGHIMHISL